MLKRIAAILAFLFVGVFAHAQTLSGVQVSPFGSVLQSGTEQFSVTCLYTDGTTDTCAGKTVTWSSSQPALVTASNSGLATYVSNCGSGAYPDTNSAWECWAHMVATVNGFSDYATIFVQYPGDTFQVMLTPALYNNPNRAATLVVGATATFGAGEGIDGSLANEGSANPFPACNWTSSNTSAGTINRYGFFTAVAPGTSTVTCTTAGNGAFTASPYNSTPATYTVTVVAGGTGTNTWYVRPDGGTPYVNSTQTPAGQCNGLANAPYPGTGVNQPCALGDFEYLYFDQVTNTQQWMISGGDTVIVAPKTGGYDTAIINASANTPSNCQGDMEYCDLPAIPSGTAAQPTRILGSNYASCTGTNGPNPSETTLLLGYGREAIRTDLSQYIDVECFEIADNSATNGFEFGIVQSAFTSYATFKNIFIHNATQSGVYGASGLGIVDDHLHIRAARMTGYNMDDGPYGISNVSVAGGLTMTNSEIEFTGCEEIYGSTAEYPFVANECLDENTGGQGDGMGTGSMTGSWYYNNDIFRYNFQDGLDNLHAGAQSETVLNSQAYGNDGQQFKFGDVNTGVFQNNLTIGNCNRIMEPFDGVTIAISGVNPCRAGGGATVFEWAGTGSYLFQNNTFIGVGNEILTYMCESTWTSCSGAATTIQNNIFGGYTDSAAPYSQAGTQAVAFYGGSSGLPGANGWVTRSNNDFYNVSDYTPTTTAEITSDPLLTGEPPFLTELSGSGESMLDNFNYTPSSNSPVLGAGVYLPLLTTDADGVTRPDPPAIGALEFAAGTTQPASQVTMIATPNPVTVGQLVTLSASVASANGVVPTGMVVFSSNGTSLGSAVLSSSAVATLSISMTAAGTDTLTAAYSGDANYVAGTSPALSLTVSPTAAAATTTLLQVSSSTITAGQTATLTATVAAGSAGTPSGTVSFYSNGTVLGTATLNSAGTATLSTASLTAGSYSMTAKYAGNTSFDASTSAPLTETVSSAAAAATKTQLQVSSNSITAGQTTTLTATVAAGSGSGTPSGTVSFYSNGAVLGTATLNDGTATLSTSSLTAGSYSMTAKYAGNTSFDASTSAALTETVKAAAAAATKTQLQVSSNTITAGQTATLTATVAAGSGSGTPSGTVSFYSNGTVLGTATLSSAGTATLSTASLTTGSYSLTAKYAGNTSFDASTSAPLTETVSSAAAAATKTQLQVSSNSITAGQTTTLTATVAAGSGSGTPSGTVSFYSNGAVLGTATLNDGTATLSTSSLTAGSYSMTAKYAGNTSFDASTSAALTETVKAAAAAATKTQLQVSSNTITAGQTATLTATVAAGSGSGTPSGTVSFYSNGTVLGTATLNSAGTATLSTGSLTTGSYSLTAKYAGNTSFDASTSAPLTETVSSAAAAATKTQLQVSSNSITAGQTTTLTATVAAGSGSGTPSGTVSFYSNGAVLGTATLNDGTATLSTSSLTAGSYSMTAKYAGNTSFDASTSAALTETVNPAAVAAPAATTTLLQSSSDPITAGQEAKLTATVASGSGGVPSGTVSFYNNGALLGTATLTGAGTATLSTASLTAGSYSMTAKYAGNTSFDASTSATLTETVNAEGVSPGVDVATSTPTLTIESGSSTSDAEVLTFTAVGGYSGTIQMACANLPAGSTCSFQSPTVTVSAATGPVHVTMTIQNSGTTTAAMLMTHDTTLAAFFWIPGLFLAALIGKKRKLLLQSRFLLLVLLLAGVAGGLTGCGSSATVLARAPLTTAFQVKVTGTGNVAQTINLAVTTE